MARAFTRIQVLENRAFLTALRRSGNIRLACRVAGLKYGTVQHRRRVHPGFAVAVGAAVVEAQARLAKVKRRLPRFTRWGHSLSPPPPHPPTASLRVPPSPAQGRGAYRTEGGEPVIVRLASGKLQVRGAQAGKLTREAERAFLSALAATCNVALAAASVGAAANAFSRRAKRDPAFARAVQRAIAEGYEALEQALMVGLDEWEEGDDEAPVRLPQMTVDQALQLMARHAKEAREEWRRS